MKTVDNPEEQPAKGPLQRLAVWAEHRTSLETAGAGCEPNSGSRKAREYTKGARVGSVLVLGHYSRVVASSKCYDYRKPSHIMIRYWIEVTDLDSGKVLNNSVCLSRKEAEDERQRLKDEDVTQQHRYGVRIRLEFVEVKTKTATRD